MEQTQAQKQARIALGTLEAETEPAPRAKEMADAQAVLTLLEAGTCAEEVEAEKARLARLLGRSELSGGAATASRHSARADGHHGPAGGTCIGSRLTASG